MDNLTNMIFSEEINYDELPFDCPARAADRLRKFFYNDYGKFTKDYDNSDYLRDRRIVLGDESKGVKVPTSEEEARKYFEDCLTR